MFNLARGPGFAFAWKDLKMVFGYAYPAYECFKAAEKNKPDTEQLLFWCQYWYGTMDQCLHY
ncbi:hypothetical protein CUMW_257640 [Citrus unshiu]|uniref:Uncharacterized protein n=1 Tax=Citrus unshiu TaxID=55188 RepID=A0A2H5QSJ2_CITUN|nr:hypothetical protein CUMW_257640 [Citrus unshiu]